VPAADAVCLDEDYDNYHSKNNTESTNYLSSPTSAAVDFIEIPANCELHNLFDDSDIEVSTVCSEDTDETAGNASFATSSLEDDNLESHLIYKEEQDVTYMVPVPKNGTPRDSSLTPISIMVVDARGLY